MPRKKQTPNGQNEIFAPPPPPIEDFDAKLDEKFGKPKRGDRIEQLEWALDKANRRARLYEMSFLSVKRSELRLVAMLLDLNVPAEKLAEWQKALDHIEAIKMNGMSRVKSVVLDAAQDYGDGNQE